MQIVIAWTETVSVWDGEPFAHDLGRPARFVEQTAAKACVWLADGDDTDVEKARDFVTGEYGSRGAVFTYPKSENDPLGRAKQEVLR